MRIPVCKDGKMHHWKSGWVCEKCGLKKADLLNMTIPKNIKKCLWCGIEYGKETGVPCCAPDGDGHLFYLAEQRKEEYDS